MRHDASSGPAGSARRWRWAPAIDGPGPRALSVVAGALTGSGQAGQAADAAGQALEATAGIDDPVQRVRALTAVAEALARHMVG
jgi:hypothetical protein